MAQDVVELDARVLVEIEQRGDRRGCAWLGAQRRERVAVEIQRAQEGLVEKLREIRFGGLLADTRDERLWIHFEELERFPEHGQLHRASSLLDEIQIRG